MSKKSLTISQMKENNKKYDEYIEVDVNDEFVLEVKKTWSDIDVAKVVVEFATTYQKMAGVMQGFDKVADLYLSILVIKKFTKLGDEIPDDFQGQLNSIEEIAKDNLLADIVNALPFEEMKKVEEQMTKLVGILNGSVEEFEKEIKNTKLKNEEVKEVMLERDDENEAGLL